MELSGGAILLEVETWLRSFINEDRAALVRSTPDMSPLSEYEERERQRKYGFDRLRAMFLLYIKCKDGRDETVTKALCENYFMRAYRAYKYSVQTFEVFDRMAGPQFESNNNLIASFGEQQSIRLCVAGFDEGREPEPEISERLAERDRAIAELRKELDVERRAADVRVSSTKEECASELDMLRRDLKKEYDMEVAKYELTIAERYESVDRENQQLRGTIKQDRAAYEYCKQETEAALTEIEKLKRQKTEEVNVSLNYLRETRRIQVELESLQTRADAERTLLQSRLADMDRDARAEIERVRAETRTVAESATEAVSALRVENATLRERVRGDGDRMLDFQKNVEKAESERNKLKAEFDRLVQFLPTAYLDKSSQDSGCSIA